MSANAQDILDTILSRLKDLASSETVVGAPVQIGEMTILPIVKISFGFGAGSGTGGDEAKPTSKGGGSGGGGGGVVTPIGFVVFDGTEVKFVSVAGKGKLDAIFEAVPELIKKFSSIKMKVGKDGDKGETESE